MCTFWTLCSHVCEPNLSGKVLENEFCESWKTLEFRLCKSWKVLENSLLLSVRTLMPVIHERIYCATSATTATATTITTTTVLWPLSRDCLGELILEQSPTHSYPDHESSFISFLHLLQSIASSIATQSPLPSVEWETSTS